MKALSSHTQLAESLVVFPEHPGQRDVARELQRALAARGVRVTEIEGAEATDDVLSQHDLIAPGNLATNPLIERLYRELYCWVDLWYPGVGGHVLQTIHGPYVSGRNVVLLGASDAAGLEWAAGQLLALAGQGGILPWTHQVQLGGRLRSLRRQRGDGERAIVMPWRQTAFGTDERAGTAGGAIVRAGYEYLFTGDEMAGAEYRALMLDPATTFDHLTFWHKIVQWDLMEQCPVFSEDDRLRLRARILEVLRSEEGARNDGFLELLPRHEPRQNHQTRVALALFFGGRYFRKRGLAEADDWLALARRFFEPQMACSKGMCDDNADQWQGSLDNTAIYALASGDMRFFENGMMRLAAERAIANCNNMGEMVPLGDAWDTYYPVTILSKAAYYYRDGGSAWWLARRDPLAPAVLTDDPLRSFSAGVEPREPTEHVGLMRTQLQPLYYRFVGGREPSVPLREAFDKIAFRSGLGERDLYFLLDGASGGSHSYDDANSLIEVSQYGRVFLTTLDNQTGPAYADHNAVTVTRDGRGARPPALAAVEATAMRGGWAYTRTAVRGYNGADWMRHLWANADRFLMVADELTARVEGDFIFIARWRTLGEARLEGEAFISSQAPYPGSPRPTDDFVIQTLPGATLGYEVDDLPTGKEPLRHYPYAPMHVNVLRQRKAAHLREGERVVFWNLLDTPWWVDDPGLRAVAAQQEALVDDRIRQPLLFTLGVERPRPAPATRAAATPVTDRWDGVARRAVREVWRYAGESPVLAMCASDHGMVLGTSGGEIVMLDGEGAVLWRHRAQGPVRTLHASDIIVAGSDDGRVYAFSRDGELRWTFAPPFLDVGFAWWTLGSSQVRRVMVVDLDGDGRDEVLAGVGNMHLHALDADGRQRWEFTTRYGVFSTFTITDYDGDGRLEIIGGTNVLSCVSDAQIISRDGAHLATLRNDGWVSSLSALLVMPGEHGPVVVCGTDIGNVRAFAAPEGRFLWEESIGDGVTALTECEGMVIVGSESGTVSAFAPDGTRLWYAGLPDVVTSVVTTGGEVMAGDASEGLWWLSRDGSISAKAAVRGGVRELLATDRGSLVVCTGHGQVALLQPD